MRVEGTRDDWDLDDVEEALAAAQAGQWRVEDGELVEDAVAMNAVSEDTVR